ncbi:MAG: type VI secretion system TssO [Ginsengibacter sp.]
MQPINKDDRRKAFISFLLLFLLSTGLIILIVFFSIQVPFKQNEQLTKQMSAYQKERDFSQNFFIKMSDINNMLDSINTKSQRPDLLDGDITEAIKKLNSEVNSDSTDNKNIYANVVQVMSDLQSSKKQLRERTGTDDNINELKKTVDDLSAKLNQSLYREASLTQQIINMSQRAAGGGVNR